MRVCTNTNPLWGGCPVPFADKDALFYEVLKIGFSDLQERFVAIRAKGDKATSKEQALKRCCMLSQTYISWASESTALWHMMFGRIGMLCRNETLQHSDLSRDTPFDVSLKVTRDLFRLELLGKEPDRSDIRCIWSVTHGAADLAQSGVRMLHTQPDQICADTTVRCLRSIGFETAPPKAPAQQ